MRLRENLLNGAGGPLKRYALRRLIGDRDARGIIRVLRERYQPRAPSSKPLNYAPTCSRSMISSMREASVA
jgi:hypothetical protein